MTKDKREKDIIRMLKEIDFTDKAVALGVKLLGAGKTKERIRFKYGEDIKINSLGEVTCTVSEYEKKIVEKDITLYPKREKLVNSEKKKFQDLPEDQRNMMYDQIENAYRLPKQIKKNNEKR
jgi:hypothetical protein